MERHTQIRAYLNKIEQILKDHDLWQSTIPSPSALESTEPFCIDTLEPHEWLQWVLIPRMHALLDSHRALPESFAVSPYYEMALDNARPECKSLLTVLAKLDALFAVDNA